MASALDPPKLQRATSDESQFSFETLGAGSDCSADVASAVLSSSRVIDVASVSQRMKLLCSETSELLGVSDDDAMLLLLHFRWSTVALNEAFFEDDAKLRRLVGLSSAAASFPSDQVCGICFTDPPRSLLPCGDSSFCDDCWRTYAQSAVRDGKNCIDLRCPAVKCHERVRPSVMRELCASEPDLLQRYNHFLVVSCVEGSRSLSWCPGPGCALVAEAGVGMGIKVQCDCGHAWCFDCKADIHAPVECSTVEQWNAKSQDIGQDAQWILLNTRPCPKCKNPIEKNGGCMHMTCRPPGGCGHEFCWLCLQPYKSHRVCNAFVEEETADRKSARSDLQRYAHYFQRFQDHERAQRFATTVELQAKEMLAQLLEKQRGWPVKDLEFLHEAVMEIAASRRFLKWTYAHAYMTNISGKKKELFDFHQAQLEGTLERLSDVTENTHWAQFLEPDIPFAQFSEVRGNVLSLTSVVRVFFLKFAEEMKAVS